MQEAVVVGKGLSPIAGNLFRNEQVSAESKHMNERTESVV